MGNRARRLVHVYADTKQGWRWRLMSSGRIIADSGQSYTRAADALAAFKHLELGVPHEIRVFDAGGACKSKELVG